MLLRLVVLNKVSIFRISFLLTLDIPISLIFFCVYLRFLSAVICVKYSSFSIIEARFCSFPKFFTPNSKTLNF